MPPPVLPVLRSYASRGVKIVFVWPRTLERLVPAALADPLTFEGAAVACSQHRNFVTCHAPTSLWRSEGDRDPVWRDQQQQTLFAGYPATVSACGAWIWRGKRSRSRRADPLDPSHSRTWSGCRFTCSGSKGQSQTCIAFPTDVEDRH
eukprot:s2934_g19.t1